MIENIVSNRILTTGVRAEREWFRFMRGNQIGIQHQIDKKWSVTSSQQRFQFEESRHTPVLKLTKEHMKATIRTPV